MMYPTIADELFPSLIQPVNNAVAILAVSSDERDHAQLRQIVSRSNWWLYEANTCHEVMEFLRESPVAVLVCASEVADGTWKSLLNQLEMMLFPPLMVVTSDHDEPSLWAEVLSYGAYDFLCKPFDDAEVTRIISLAWLHWREKNRKDEAKITAGFRANAA